ncbi:MAG TPA: hypothetical protein VIO14_04510 [Dehalococcoidia bacterium]
MLAFIGRWLLRFALLRLARDVRHFRNPASARAYVREQSERAVAAARVVGCLAVALAGSLLLNLLSAVAVLVLLLAR